MQKFLNLSLYTQCCMHICNFLRKWPIALAKNFLTGAQESNVLKFIAPGFLSWHSRLRIRHCGSLGHCQGLGSNLRSAQWVSSGLKDPTLQQVQCSFLAQELPYAVRIAIKKKKKIIALSKTMRRD